MLINGKRKIKDDLEVFMDGQFIKQVDCINYLGVHVADNLAWYSHLKRCTLK